MNSHYCMLIQWSEEDEAFLVTLPEFANVVMPCTHGKTYGEAARNGAEVIELLVEDYQAEKYPLPEPKLFLFEEIETDLSSSPN